MRLHIVIQTVSLSGPRFCARNSPSTDELEGNGKLYFADSISACMWPKQISSALCKQVVVFCPKRAVFLCSKLDVTTVWLVLETAFQLALQFLQKDALM